MNSRPSITVLEVVLFDVQKVQNQTAYSSSLEKCSLLDLELGKFDTICLFSNTYFLWLISIAMQSIFYKMSHFIFGNDLENMEQAHGPIFQNNNKLWLRDLGQERQLIVVYVIKID